MVTGCNRGIGLELVKRFVAEGCNNIFACSRSMSAELEELAKHESVHHIELEITKPDEVEAAYEKVQGVLGKSNNPVPRLSFATRFDTKLQEKSFEKQNSAKAVLFTMYVSTV